MILILENSYKVLSAHIDKKKTINFLQSTFDLIFSLRFMSKDMEIIRWKSEGKIFPPTACPDAARASLRDASKLHLRVDVIRSTRKVFSFFFWLVMRARTSEQVGETNVLLSATPPRDNLESRSRWETPTSCIFVYIKGLHMCTCVWDLYTASKCAAAVSFGEPKQYIGPWPRTGSKFVIPRAPCLKIRPSVRKLLKYLPMCSNDYLHVYTTPEVCLTTTGEYRGVAPPGTW